MPGVERIFIATAAKAPVQPVDAVEAVAGRGLVGDRYFLGVGAFSRWPGEGRQITLIEAETIEGVLADSGIDLGGGEHRRNVVTRGVRLNELVEKQFRLGPLRLRGQRLCAPCRYLDGIIGQSVFRAMKGRGGLRAEILEGGLLRVGDGFEKVSSAAATTAAAGGRVRRR